MNNKKIMSVIIVGVFALLAGLAYSFGTAGTDGAVVINTNPSGMSDEFNKSEPNQMERDVSGLTNEDGQTLETGHTSASEDVRNNGLPDTREIKDETDNLSSESGDRKAMIYVHICGEVKKPDVYMVEEGSRIIDLIQLAGGFTKHAAADYINQAEKAADGQKIYIPSTMDVEGISFYEYSSQTIKAEGQNDLQAVSETENKGEQQYVNINTAGLSELMTLTGIGQAKAKSIIAYREANGNFRTIEELMNIEGIKEGVFQKIRDFIITN